MSVEKRLQECFKELANDYDISLSNVNEFIESEYGKEALRGYGLFTTPDTDNLLVVEKIDEMDIYKSDIEAGDQMKKDFENGISDYTIIDPSEYPNVYPLNCYRIVDTKENRKELKIFLEKLQKEEF